MLDVERRVGLPGQEGEEAGRGLAGGVGDAPEGVHVVDRLEGANKARVHWTGLTQYGKSRVH